MLKTFKSLARSAWPSAYRQIASIKERATAPGWDYYFDAVVPSLRVPEACVVALAPKIPDYIDTILIIGCAPGRDFIPFEKTHKLRGIDLAPFERVKWVCDTTRLSYRQMTAQVFARTLNEDLSNTLVYASGTLMQLRAQEQNELYESLKQNGCRNFIFQEPPPDHSNSGYGRRTGAFICPCQILRR